jgi:hypothetical protein
MASRFLGGGVRREDGAHGVTRPTAYLTCPAERFGESRQILFWPILFTSLHPKGSSIHRHAAGCRAVGKQVKNPC